MLIILRHARKLIDELIQIHSVHIFPDIFTVVEKDSHQPVRMEALFSESFHFGLILRSSSERLSLLGPVSHKRGVPLTRVQIHLYLRVQAEMDTVVGGQKKGKACLLVLSERMTREEIVIKIKNKKASSVVHALNMLERKLGSRKFREKFKTITCDNGCEFMDAKGIEKSRYTKGNRTTLYYCHPYSSYERGTNENINRMIRRFFPKGINFDIVTQKEVTMVQDWINNYPRKIFGGLSSNLYRESLNLAA